MKPTYTTAKLFQIIIDKLEAKGLLPDSIDYATPAEDIPIITEEWSTSTSLCYGLNEGIYLDIMMNGHIDDIDGDNKEICMGTIKTLYVDDDEMLKMSALGAHFLIEATDFVNEHLDDFTWYGGDVKILNSDGSIEPYMSCYDMDSAYMRAEEYNNKNPGKENEGGNSQPNPREGKWAIVRDNTTRKMFFADKTPYIPTAEVGLDEQENSDKEEM